MTESFIPEYIGDLKEELVKLEEEVVRLTTCVKNWSEVLDCLRDVLLVEDTQRIRETSATERLASTVRVDALNSEIIRVYRLKESYKTDQRKAFVRAETVKKVLFSITVVVSKDV